MDGSKRLLIAIDDSKASNRALRYVADVLRGTQNFTVFLLHMLGPLPTRLRESRGAETPEGEEEVEARLVEKQNRFIKRSSEEVGALLDGAKAILMSAGVSAEAIERACPELVDREDLVSEILREARDRGCSTIVVGRESFAGLKEVFVGHLADDLIQQGQGLAFWVVE